MSEHKNSAVESSCSPNGFGFCSTHPTCDYVRAVKDELLAKIERLQRANRSDEKQLIGILRTIGKEVTDVREGEKSVAGLVRQEFKELHAKIEDRTICLQQAIGMAQDGVLPRDETSNRWRKSIGWHKV